MATTTTATSLDIESLRDFEVFSYLPEVQGASPTDESLVSLKISSSWTYCGPLLSLDPSSLPASFYTWTEATVNGSILTPFFTFMNFVHKFLSTNNLSHYWLTIRATKGSHEFDIPRWHADDQFFSQTQLEETSLKTADPLSGEPLRRRWSKRRSESDRKYINLHLRSADNRHRNTPSSALRSSPARAITSPENAKTTDWKLATTLLGPGTRFISRRSSTQARAIRQGIIASIRAENQDHICSSVRCVGCAMASDKVREQLAEALKDHETFQPRFGECTFFRTGEEGGAIHSEPQSHGDRIFVNIVPGEEKELIALAEKWGLEYPRAWCVGLPLMWGEECRLRDI